MALPDVRLLVVSTYDLYMDNISNNMQHGDNLNNPLILRRGVGDFHSHAMSLNRKAGKEMTIEDVVDVNHRLIATNPCRKLATTLLS